MTRFTTVHQIAIPAAGTYRLDPDRSTIVFRTRHLFGLGAVSGSMKVASGEILIDPARPRASIQVIAKAASFDTGNEQRDSQVREARFLDVERYPDVGFRAGILSRDGDEWTLDGYLTVRGETKPVSLTIDSVQTVERSLQARATMRIDRYAFGITAARGMAARYLTLELTAVAEPV